MVNRLEPATKKQQSSGPGDPAITGSLLTLGDLLVQTFVVFPILFFTCIFVAKMVGFHSALRKDRTYLVFPIIAQVQPSPNRRLKFYCMHGVALG